MCWQGLAERTREALKLCTVISAKGVFTDPSKIEVVAEWPPPTSLWVEVIAGVCQLLSVVCGRLHQLGNTFALVSGTAGRSQRQSRAESVGERWTEECKCSFEALKTNLNTALVLAYAYFLLPFALEIDTRFGGLGAVLSQK